MILERLEAARLKRLKDVSPSLRIVAAPALAGSDRETRKKILVAIRNTAASLSDEGAIKDAKYTVNEARAEGEAEALGVLGDLDAEIPAWRPGLQRRASNRALARVAARRGVARRMIDALNDMLASIGRPGI